MEQGREATRADPTRALLENEDELKDTLKEHIASTFSKGHCTCCCDRARACWNKSDNIGLAEMVAGAIQRIDWYCNECKSFSASDKTPSEQAQRRITMLNALREEFKLCRPIAEQLAKFDKDGMCNLQHVKNDFRNDLVKVNDAWTEALWELPTDAREALGIKDEDKGKSLATLLGAWSGSPISGFHEFPHEPDSEHAALLGKDYEETAPTENIKGLPFVSLWQLPALNRAVQEFNPRKSCEHLMTTTTKLTLDCEFQHWVEKKEKQVQLQSQPDQPENGTKKSGDLDTEKPRVNGSAAPDGAPVEPVQPVQSPAERVLKGAKRLIFQEAVRRHFSIQLKYEESNTKDMINLSVDIWLLADKERLQELKDEKSTSHTGKTRTKKFKMPDSRPTSFKVEVWGGEPDRVHFETTFDSKEIYLSKTEAQWDEWVQRVEKARTKLLRGLAGIVDLIFLSMLPMFNSSLREYRAALLDDIDLAKSTEKRLLAFLTSVLFALINIVIYVLDMKALYKDALKWLKSHARLHES